MYCWNSIFWQVIVCAGAKSFFSSLYLGGNIKTFHLQPCSLSRDTTWWNLFSMDNAARGISRLTKKVFYRRRSITLCVIRLPAKDFAAIACLLEVPLLFWCFFLQVLLSCFHLWRMFNPEAKFLDEIQTRVLRNLLLAIHSDFHSFALRFNSSNLLQFLQFSYRTL